MWIDSKMTLVVLWLVAPCKQAREMQPKIHNLPWEDIGGKIHKLKDIIVDRFQDDTRWGLVETNFKISVKSFIYVLNQLHGKNINKKGLTLIC